MTSPHSRPSPPSTRLTPVPPQSSMGLLRFGIFGHDYGVGGGAQGANFTGGGNTRGSSNPLLAAPQITSELEGVDKISRRCTSGSWRYGWPRDSPGPSAPRGIGTSRNFGRLLGEEVYGKFLLDVLEAEGINVVGMLENTDASPCRQAYEMLLCWVLVDPFKRHGFCSRADFSEEPAFSWIRKLPAETKTAVHHSKILFCNGYAFDEFFLDVIASAIDCAIDAGTTIFFDPGPHGKSLLHGTLDEQRALEHSLKLSNVLLLTSDELMWRIMRTETGERSLSHLLRNGLLGS